MGRLSFSNSKRRLKDSSHEIWEGWQVDFPQPKVYMVYSFLGLSVLR